MAVSPKARLVGWSSYLPERVLSNADLEKIVETTDEWIVSRTGMKERRIAAADEFTSDMGAIAARKALVMANVKPEEIDLILVATMSPDHLCPSTASLIQKQIGASLVPCVDVLAACTGYLYALSIAKAYVESGMANRVLVVAAEKMSAFVDYQDRNTCVLFGDGAAAGVVSNKGAGLAIDTICLGADGEVADLLTIPAGGSRIPATADSVNKGQHYLKMVGKEVFKHAVRRMAASAKDCLQKAGLAESQISWLVPHQANIRIIDAIAKTFQIPEEKVFKTVHKYGNTSASSIAIALDELQKEHAVKPGERILLVAFGGGLTWGATILTKVTE